MTVCLVLLRSLLLVGVALASLMCLAAPMRANDFGPMFLPSVDAGCAGAAFASVRLVPRARLAPRTVLVQQEVLVPRVRNVAFVDPGFLVPRVREFRGVNVNVGVGGFGRREVIRPAFLGKGARFHGGLSGGF